jgi:hypothetical protein
VLSLLELFALKRSLRAGMPAVPATGGAIHRQWKALKADQVANAPCTD